MGRRICIRATLISLLPLSVVAWPIPAALLYGLLALSQPSKRITPATLPAMALMATAMLSAVASGRGALVLVEALAVPATFVLLWLFATRIDRSDAAPVAIGIILLLSTNVLLSLVQVHWQGLNRAMGLTFHANILAALAVSSMLLFVANVRIGRFAVLLRVVGIVLGATLIVYSASRAAAIAAVVVAVGVLIVVVPKFQREKTYSPNPRRWILVATVGLVISGLWMTEYLNIPLFDRFQTAESIRDALGRPLLWSASLDLLIHRPVLGFGPSAWSDYISIVEPVIRPNQIPHVHNQYLDLALRTGVLGLGSLVWFGLALFRYFWRGRFKDLGWAVTGMSTLIAMAVVCMFDTPASHLQVLVPSGLVVSLAIAHLGGSARANIAGERVEGERH